MKILKILWHIVGIACSAMILPSFVSSITTALLSLQPQRMVIFFIYPLMSSSAAAEISNMRAVLTAGAGYLMYLIAFAYAFWLIKQIYGWYKKAKQLDKNTN
ncbi:lipoprotein [Listeria floridensis FSL S10-1187]|uniref:Lipoprotein n=1 Tax=Listeria floridensis FSL S10-1187 TaxID=1265817 RepID=A0ABN0RC33_9LIST|nr:hypothetical protein [Listeria floridensis]EUJ26165.1 lipoprotein [Listeria floridensis FSL S10-1187]